MLSSVSITFLGTASAVPSASRNHSALALKLDGDVWIFDCGEDTQKQIQRATHGVRMGAIRRIFITHMHGDHVFGIVPLMAAVLDGVGGTVVAPDPRAETAAAATATAEPASPLEIYGPRGLRRYIRMSLECTYTNLAAPYRVHELLLPGETASTLPSETLNEAEVLGEDITSSDASLFPDFLQFPDLSVSAGAILHSVPALGYVVHETRVPGKIKPEDYVPHIQRNKAALAAQGVSRPLSLLSQLQAGGAPIRLPDGTALVPPPDRPGRKIVILGDTHDAEPIAPLAQDADVLVHEATNAFLPGLDATTKPDDTLESVQAKSREHGHSTPQVAGAFARKVGARRLLLNHFSNRYKGDDDEESTKVMEGIRQLAVDAFGNDDVVCARDLMRVEVPRRMEDAKAESAGPGP